VVLREFRVICIALFLGSAWLYVVLAGISDCLHGSLNN
jgi:hypothetical protein